MILAIIIIGIIFWRMAQKKNLTPIVWAIIAPASYFVAQLIVGFIVGVYNPYFFNNYATILVVGLASGFVGLTITWFAMLNAAKKKDEFVKDEFSDVLDDEYLEKL